MKINLEKSCIILNHISKIEAPSLLNIILAQKKSLQEGFKYLGFYLKPNKQQVRGLELAYKKIGVSNQCMGHWVAF